MMSSRPAGAILAFCIIVLTIGRSSQQGLQPYPSTARGHVVESLHGVQVADPYRWLEEPDDPAVSDWVRAQADYSGRFFERLSTREHIRQRLHQLWLYSRIATPWREAGHLFFLRSDGVRAQPVLYTAATAKGEPRLVFDPNQVFPTGSVAVRDYVVSPDGRLVAYATAEGGADAGVEHVRELATGRELNEQVTGVWNSVCWNHDASGFFYIRSPESKTGRGSARIEKQVLYHVLRQSQSADRLIQKWSDNYRWAYCMTSEDGAWEIVVAERGAESDLFAMRLDGDRRPESNAPLIPLLAGRRAMFTPVDIVANTLYVHTDLDAPRHRVIAVNLTEGSNARPLTLIPEAPHVIDTVAIAGDKIVVDYLVDASSRLRLFTLDGRPVSEVTLPGVGSVGDLNGRPSTPEFFYSFRSFLSPATVYRFDPRSGANVPFEAPHVSFDARAYETRQVFYTSKDGTRVPMFITARKDVERDGTNPTLLTGYGGYGASITPDYLPDLPLWLDTGGIYAVANLRGGGEYGEAWHRAGMLERKQNSFDDFIAAAEYLVAGRYTSSRRLAIYGHSNGGLLVGAAITQRPDLFAAAVANAGHYDMLRYHQFTAGAGWIPEYGSPDDPKAFRYLLRYSPLHQVRNGTCYPATLLLAADHDDRVVPSHSYKFAAALQAAQRCEQPVLLRVARGASHSYASTNEHLAEQTDMWAFIADRLGVTLKPH